MNEELSPFITSIELGGTRLPDGKLKSNFDKKLLDDWPKEIVLFGYTYTLDETYDSDGYETAVYL